MIISKIYNKLNKSQKEDVVVGLVLGLVWGLVVGLVYGLDGRLVGGLVGRLVWGLVGGLVWGLVVILINFKEALPFLIGFYPILFLIVGIVILIEILFLLMPKEKLKKNVRSFWHTCLRKLECLFEVLLGLSAIAQIYILIREIAKYYNKEVLEFILKLIGYVGVGIIFIVIISYIFYIWIKLNSLKYKG